MVCIFPMLCRHKCGVAVDVEDDDLDETEDG